MYFLCLLNSQLQYENTVHNIGEIFAKICKQLFILNFKDKFINHNVLKNDGYSLDSYSVFQDINIRLLLFNGYVNYTGLYLKEYVAELPNFYNEELVVVCDDITLETSSILITFAKGSGHHNGAKSIDNNLSRNYWRLRLGYKKPYQISSNDFVLSKVTYDYQKILYQITKIILEELIKHIRKTGNEKKSIQSLQEYINRYSNKKFIL